MQFQDCLNGLQHVFITKSGDNARDNYRMFNGVLTEPAKAFQLKAPRFRKCWSKLLGLLDFKCFVQNRVGSNIAIQEPQSNSIMFNRGSMESIRMVRLSFRKLDHFIPSVLLISNTCVGTPNNAIRSLLNNPGIPGCLGGWAGT